MILLYKSKTIFNKMNIFYDFEINEESTFKINNTEEILYLNELKNFIRGRLNVLKEDIENEEKTGTKATVLFYSDDIGKQGIWYYKYSEELIVKMESCISRKDIEYLHERLSNLFNRFN